MEHHFVVPKCPKSVKISPSSQVLPCLFWGRCQIPRLGVSCSSGAAFKCLFFFAFFGGRCQIPRLGVSCSSGAAFRAWVLLLPFLGAMPNLNGWSWDQSYVFHVVFGVNAPRRAWFFPRLCSLAVYVFNALADCKMTLRKTLCPTLLLTSCYLDREGGWGVGGGGGDDNVPFDCKMTLPKTRCPTLLLTSCYLDREGGWGGGDDNVPFDCKMTLPKTLHRGRLNKKLMIYVRSWQFRFAHQHQYIQTLGKLFKTKNADWKSTEGKKNALNLKQMLRNCKSFFLAFWHLESSCSKRQNIIDHKHKIL